MNTMETDYNQNYNKIVQYINDRFPDKKIEFKKETDIENLRLNLMVYVDGEKLLNRWSPVPLDKIQDKLVCVSTAARDEIIKQFMNDLCGAIEEMDNE